MRVTLNATNPLKVTSFTPFLSGGVPNDKGNANGPVPLPDRSQGYNGKSPAARAHGAAQCTVPGLTSLFLGGQGCKRGPAGPTQHG